MTKFLSSASAMFVIGFTLTPEWSTTAALLIGAIFIGLVNLYNAKTARLVAMKEVAKAVEPLVAQIAPIAAKIEEMAPVVERINTHVNSEKDRAIAELAQRDLRIELQNELIDELKKDKAALAQARAGVEIAQAVADASRPTAAAPPVAQAATAEHSLKQIDSNTAKIEQNTARTDATVQDLKKE